MFDMNKYILLAAGIAVAALLAGPAAAQDRDRSMATVAEIPLTGDDGQAGAQSCRQASGTDR